MAINRKPKSISRHDDDERTRSNAIAHALEAEILSGQLKPGDRLTEGDLAQRFGASRTPVREALRLLGAARLITVRPHRGAVVTSVPITDMVQMLEVMAEIEDFCARLAARRMTPEQRKSLAALHREYQRLVAAGDPDAYFAVSMKFHELIYAGTQNPFLAETAMQIRHRVSLMRRYQLRAPGRLAQSFREHEAILKAILKQDSAAAGRSMRRHIDIVGDTFTDIVLALPGREPKARHGQISGNGTAHRISRTGLSEETSGSRPRKRRKEMAQAGAKNDRLIRTRRKSQSTNPRHG